ncbi:hypothetical protein B0T22DRAFT_175143 [Podospora appendiculata]|uniref:Uncharacterized protein n=1 Tax=Podospora appendiculata TaxID=314037 RepID=A0AAE0XBJ7_9PEZI|nr:hypothetical protein B0T22DRAFT_175143 [Podospora appendiculata]
MRPATPNLKVARSSVGPSYSSPPQSPTSPTTPSSPGFGRKTSPKSRPMPPHNPQHPMAPLASFRLAGSRPDFSYAQVFRHDQLSPQSSSESESSQSDSDASAVSPPRSVIPEQPPPAPAPPAPQVRTGRTVDLAQVAFTVEELSDFADSDEERIGVIRPHAIEYAESDRSRSRSRNPHPPEIDQAIMNHLGNLNCSDDSDQTDIDETTYREFIIKRREAKRRRRMTSGSIGKRTISESIGSGSDREDLKPFLNADDMGSSARRLRRRIGNRHSLQFQDPPPPRIDELEEPDSSDDGLLISEALARELPYYEYVSMEIDSP